MKKVITYGTFDRFHHGHLRLLERAKQLGDYLVVGVTSDEFDRTRGKINVQDSVLARVDAVRKTGIADEVIIEEYEGQKIDDINRLGIDVFTVGSDWVGHFDYLKRYCDVVYLDRTVGVSSSSVRSEDHKLRMGLIGNSSFLDKFYGESRYVNGIEVVGVCSDDLDDLSPKMKSLKTVTNRLEDLLNEVDAVYVISPPSLHYKHIKECLSCGKHVLCEAPISVSCKEYDELMALSERNGVKLMEALRVAYTRAYRHLLLLLKGGAIGKITSVDATCTSLRAAPDFSKDSRLHTWNSFCTWAPTALLPIFQILGEKYNSKVITSNFLDEGKWYDGFTKVSFVFPHAVASMKVGKGVKSEGELVVSGTEGYIYVPAPWWKMNYFEMRYENQEDNKRYFYPLYGEGIREELVDFIRLIEGEATHVIGKEISRSIALMMNDFFDKKDLIEI